MSDIIGVLRGIPGLLDGAQFSSNYVMIRCPFHGGGQERTPSCSVAINKPVFFCHACTEGGHVRKLLHASGIIPDVAKTLLDDIHYTDDVEIGRAGPMTMYSGEDPFRGQYILDEEILDEFRLAPADLLEAGFTQKTLRHFEVGFDYDNYRITYPIRNVYGELVGVSGRTVIGAEPRYKLYRTELMVDALVPEDYTMDSVKEAVLWHAHITYPFLWNDEEPVLVVEGFKAAMWIWQSGYHNVVALIGSYCSPLQVELLARTRSPVLLFLDNNEAGIKGTAKALKKLLYKGANELYCVRYPDLREQPDGLHPPEIRTAIQQSQRHYEWKREHRNELLEDARKRQAWNWKLPRKATRRDEGS